METLIFLLKVNIVFAVLLGAYYLAFRKSPLFAANRAWLLLMPVVAFMVPLVRLPASVPMAGTMDLLSFSDGSSGFVTERTTSHLGMGDVVFAIYVAGVLISLLVLAIRYVRAWRFSRSPHGEALSFFGHIVLPADLNGDEQRSLAAHEQVHARKGHSYDVLYYELLAAASWWNPLWRLALSYLRTVHELQADAVASTLHPDYGRLLLSRALGIPVSSLVNSFRSPNLKTRIAMLNITTSRYAKLKYALSIPLLALAFVAVSPRAAFDLPLVQEPVYDLSKLGVQPEFPGGMAAMYEFLASTIQYPDGALKENVQGKVFVQFVVGSDGKVRDAEVRRGVRKDLDDEAVRAISTMPDWKPGQMNGKAVATRFTVPIDFKLKGEDGPDED